MTTLIVDDHAAVRDALSLLLEVHGLPAVAVAGPDEAIARVGQGGIVAVIQDMNFSRDTTSGEEGAALFRQLREVDPQLPVLLMTAWTSLETAVRLVREGAADYIQKPWDDQKLITSLQEMLKARVARRDLERREVQRHDLRGLVYVSEVMHRVVELAIRIASSDAPALILGPNGSGKEKLAEIIAHASTRKNKPFVRVNAGAIPDSLFESEFFGVEPGAFTGASKARVGYFEAADGGTLFLDEVGNLSSSGQQKLLRVLQTGEVQRLGGARPRRVDVRVISATNEDLPLAIAQRTFREDLYFRLNVVELSLPPLGERREDILPLAQTFLAECGGPTPLTLSPDAERALCRHDFPGNVRELKNRITRACIVCRDDHISPVDLGFAAATPSNATPAEPSHDAIASTLARCEGNVSRAAAELGMSRQALYRRMTKLRIQNGRRSPVAEVDG